jgi:hypothetical protein
VRRRGRSATGCRAPPLNAGRDDEHALDDTINVTDPRTGAVVSLHLNRCADVSFLVSADDLCQSVSEFAHEFLEPAATALVQQIDRQVADVGPMARPVFARLHPPRGEFAAVEVVDGLAVRVVQAYDIQWRSMVISVDALYGIIAKP